MATTRVGRRRLKEHAKIVAEPETRARLEGIGSERCLAVMALPAGPSLLAPPGGLVPDYELVSWIVDNQLKGISA